MSLRKWIAGVAAATGLAATDSAAEPPKPTGAPKAAALTFGSLRTASPEAVRARVEGFLKAEGKLDQAIHLPFVQTHSSATVLPPCGPSMRAWRAPVASIQYRIRCGKSCVRFSNTARFGPVSTDAGVVYFASPRSVPHRRSQKRK